MDLTARPLQNVRLIFSSLLKNYSSNRLLWKLALMEEKCLEAPGSSPGASSKKPKQILAAFDFDGTISYTDTLLFFLYHAFGWKIFWNSLKALPKLCLALFQRQKRKHVKEALFSSFFKGVSSQTIQQMGTNFARGPLNKHIQPEAIEKIRWHQKRGHLTFIVSANLEEYLLPWGKANGFDATLGSRLDYDCNGKATGKLLGENCRGIEKVRRLEALLGSLDDYTLYAYGNSPGDEQLLAKADFPTLVSKKWGHLKTLL